MHSILLSVFFLVFSISPSLYSQTCRDVSVELSAEVQDNPPRITLHWVSNANATGYFVYRKLKSGSSWGAVIGNLPGTATQFIDSTVAPRVSYEYRVVRQADAFNGYGYINSGINIPEVESKGILILIIDSTFIDSLSVEIERLEDDLTGDGWRVVRLDVSRNADVKEVKSMIVTIYNLSPASTRALFLLGHVPVPYSGEINVDGHADHTGAYPADVYYGDINGSWTDVIVNNVTATDPRNHNVPEDGKFDQGLIPSDVDLQTGRVDFFNMPAFAATETDLLRNYLDKDHAYRHKKFTVEHRALVDDNFGYFSGEAFAASAWKNNGPLVGNGNVVEGDYFTDMASGSYLWSYGCGGGWYQGAGGIGSTTDFANADLQSVFTMLFGSYFGDWDTQNNFLRAALAQGKTLTNVWSGRPHWEFHHMGLGENIGYDVRISQNNSSLYNASFGGRIIHIAFMGDPTLKNDIVAPVSDVTATLAGSHGLISWTASPDTVLGYHVYRKNDDMEEFIRVNDDLITGTQFTDSCLYDPGAYDYMVRAVVLQHTPSGTYFNLSTGIMDSLLNDQDPLVYAEATYDIDEDIVAFTNMSTNATHYLWLFGDGQSSTEVNPVHDYIDGDFTATLIASNECDADTIYLLITILTSTEETKEEQTIYVYPNPSAGQFNISFEEDNALVRIFSSTGRLVYEDRSYRPGRFIELKDVTEGMYIVSILTDDNEHIKKLIITR